MTITRAFKASSLARRMVFKLSKTFTTVSDSTSRTPRTNPPSPARLFEADMKTTFFNILATLAVSAIAAPFQAAARTSNALAQPHRAMTMKRSEFKNSELLKRASSVVGSNNKRGDDIAESVNYILVLFKDDDSGTDAYQDEVDAVADPADVLG